MPSQLPSRQRPAVTGQHLNPDHDVAGEVILGVDTHKDIHVGAVISSLGVLLGSRDFPATAAGYRRLLAWARAHGPIRRAGVEGTASYGAALARMLRGAGIKVIEVNQPDRASRRRRGKTDAIDAEAAARAVLSGRAAAVAKSGDGPVEITRMLKLAKTSAVKSRTQAINQLKAVLVGADAALRESMAGLSTPRLVKACALLDDDAAASDVTRTTRYTLRLLARRITSLTGEIGDLDARLAATIGQHAPQLLARNGVGPDTAAALLIAAGDNPGRWTPRPRSRRCAGSARSKPLLARPSACASTAVATGRQTPPCTASPCPACDGIRPPATTPNGASVTARPAVRPSAASSATSPGNSTH